MNARLLGILGMVGAPMLLVEGILFNFQQHETTQLVGLLGLIYTGGWLCSLIGLYRLNAAGHRAAGKAVLIVQMALVALAIMWAIIHVSAASPNKDNFAYQVTDLGWPLSHVFMIVVGIAALIARVLPGWQRFTPLLCGLALPAAIVGSIAAGDTASNIIFPAYTAVAFMLLAYTVYTSERSAARTYAASAS